MRATCEQHQILLGDAPALLEVMAERHVSLGGRTHPVPDPFLVLATRNPAEHGLADLETRIAHGAGPAPPSTLSPPAGPSRYSEAGAICPPSVSTTSPETCFATAC